MLFGSNIGDGSQVASLTRALRDAAGRDVVVALDEEGGDVTRLDARVGSSAPGAAALGALDDPATTEAVYAAIGRRLAHAGVTVDLAPVADVNLDPRNPVIGVRSFSADPQVAARHVAAAVRGVQRGGRRRLPEALPRPWRHHGRLAPRIADRHERIATNSRPTNWCRFAPAIAAGARAIMTGHLLVPALDPESPATVSRPITTGLLREHLGFTGTIVTDALEMRAIAGTIGIAEGFVRSLIAGADAVETGAQDAEALDRADPGGGRFRRRRRTPADRATGRCRARGRRRWRRPTVACDGEMAVPDVAARCVEVRGELPLLRNPFVVECQTPNGVATGELPWSVAEAIAARAANTDIAFADGPMHADVIESRAQGRSLVVVVRDPRRHPWQQSLLDAAARHQDSVIVDVGWPAEGLPPDVPLVRTRGIAPGLLAAAAELLAPTP